MNSLVTAINNAEINFLPASYDKVIESNLGTLFFSGETIYKVYRTTNDYFIDFSTPERFKSFLDLDVLWNEAVAPRIYTKSHWMSYTDGAWISSSQKSAQNVIMEMRLIDGPNLTQLLQAGQLSLIDLQALVSTLHDQTIALTNQLHKHTYPLERQTWHQFFRTFMEQALPWCEQSSHLIPLQWSQASISKIVAAIDADLYIKSMPTVENAGSIDSHSDNIFYVDGSPVIIDSMLPNDDWRVADPFANVAKALVDIRVYTDDDTITTLYQQYGTMAALPPTRTQEIYEAAYALLKAVYVANFGPTEMVPKYQALVDRLD